MRTSGRFSRGLLFAFLVLVTALAARAQVALEKEDYDYAYRLYNDALYDLAASQFLRFAEVHPESPRTPECVYMAGESFLRAGKTRKAKDAFSRVVVEFSQSSYVDRALFGLAEVYARWEKPCAAGASLERVAVLVPNSARVPDALIRAARLYVRCGRTTRAAELLERVLHDFRGTTSADVARLELARLRLRTGKPDLAENLLNQLKPGQTSDSLAAEAALASGELYASLLRFDKAEERFRQVAENAPASSQKARGILALAELKLARGDASGALEIVRGLPSRGLLDSLAWRARILETASAACSRAQPSTLDIFNGQPQALPRKIRREVLLARSLIAEGMRDTSLLAQSSRALWNEVKNDSTCLWPVTALRLWLSGGSTEAVRAAVVYSQTHPGADSLYGISVLAVQALLQHPDQRLKAESLLNQFLLRFPSAPDADLAAFLVIRARLHANTVQVQDLLKQWLKQFPESELEPQVQALADSFALYVPRVGAEEAKVVLSLAATAAGGRAGAISYLDAAEVALSGLKDYRLASLLARRAVSAGLRGRSLAKALRLLGESFLRRSRVAARAGNVELSHQLADSAGLIFDLTLKRTSAGDDCGLKRDYAAAILSGSGDVADKLTKLKSLAEDSSQVCGGVLLTLSKTLWELSGHGEHDSTALEAFRTAARARASGGRIGEEASFLRVQIALARGDTASARQELSWYLQNFGPEAAHWGRAGLIAGRLFLAEGKAAQAVYRLKQVLERRAYSDLGDSARVLWAKAERLQGRSDVALSILGKIRQLGLVAYGRGRLPAWTVCFARSQLIRTAEVQLEKARAFLTREKPVQALALVGQLRPVLPALGSRAQVSALMLQAEAAKRLGRTSEWLYALRTVWENASLPLSDRKKAGFALLDGLFEVETYDRALELARALQKELTDPTEIARAAELEVVCTFRLDQPKKAKALAKRFKDNFKGVADLNVAEARFAYEEGEYYFRQKLFDRAEKAYRKAVGHKNTKWARLAEFAIARTYLTLNKTDKALNQLTDLPRKYPGTEVADLALLNLGVFYHQNKQLANAIFALSKVVADSQRLKPGTLRSAERELIRCYDEAGMWDRAIALSRDYLRRFPDAQDAFSRKVQIGVLLIRLNEYDRAIDYLRQLKLEADAESQAEVQYWIGKAFLSKGDLETAIAELLRVKYACPPTKLPWDVTAMFEAATAYMRLEKYDRAQKLFEQIVRLRGSTSNFGRSALQKIKEIQQLRGT